MANITRDIQTYVNELIAEQLGYLDHKGRSLTPNQKPEEKDNNFIRELGSWPDKFFQIGDNSDE